MCVCYTFTVFTSTDIINNEHFRHQHCVLMLFSRGRSKTIMFIMSSVCVAQKMFFNVKPLIDATNRNKAAIKTLVAFAANPAYGIGAGARRPGQDEYGRAHQGHGGVRAAPGAGSRRGEGATTTVRSKHHRRRDGPVYPARSDVPRRHGGLRGVPWGVTAESSPNDHEGDADDVEYNDGDVVFDVGD